MASENAITAVRSSDLTSPSQRRVSNRASNRLQRLVSETDTYAGYRNDYKLFMQWRKQTGISHEGVLVDDLINFLCDQAEGVLSVFNRTAQRLEDGAPVRPATLNRRKWAIISILQKQGVIFDERAMIELKAVSASFNMIDETDMAYRSKGGAAIPLMPSDVGAMIKSDAMKSNGEFHRLRDQAILAFFLVTGARKSEILGKNGIRFGNLSFSSKGLEFKRVVLKKGMRSHTFKGSIPFSSERYSAFQIIKHYYIAMSKLDGVKPDTNLFIRVTRSGKPFKSLSPVSARGLGDWLVKYAISANLSSELVEQVKGHSLRVGAIVYLYDLGIDKRRIAEITGQSETVIESYARQRTNMSYDGGL